ncbi:transposase [Streptomyces sp. NPDC091376]|uniref:transposase n=1 Tax=Streptomyces sp. NPDC091376 TaxID=3365994 RepID=UPI0037FD2628
MGCGGCDLGLRDLEWEWPGRLWLVSASNGSVVVSPGRWGCCPVEGQTSTGWHRVTQHGRDAIVIEFAKSDCGSCPVKGRCTSAARGNRMLTLRPKEIHETTAKARTERAGIEGTVNQALDVTGLRRARYRGLPRVRLQHAFSAAAVNVVRLDAYWSDQPLRRVRTSRLERLAYRLTT